MALAAPRTTLSALGSAADLQKITPESDSSKSYALCFFKFAPNLENRIRAQYGLPLRTHYAVSTDGVPIECTAILNHQSESIFYGKYKYLNN